MLLNATQLTYLSLCPRFKIGLSSIFLVLILLIHTFALAAEENTPVNQATHAKSSSTPTINWSTDQEKLSTNHDADEITWLEVNNIKVLTLEYRAKGRKFRGNIILLHAQGENASHPRLVKPLSIQLSRLGWQVFVPNLPIEDFYTISKRNLTTGSQVTTQTTYEAYFKDSKAYQKHINETINKITPLIKRQAFGSILIGNQNSAHWLLESAKKLPSIKQVVMLAPQLPKNQDNKVKINFEGQFLPIFAFVRNNKHSTLYLNAFEKKLWQSKFQRINRGLMTKNGIKFEDNRIAKSITGWINSLQKISN